MTPCPVSGPRGIHFLKHQTEPPPLRTHPGLTRRRCPEEEAKGSAFRGPRRDSEARPDLGRLSRAPSGRPAGPVTWPLTMPVTLDEASLRQARGHSPRGGAAPSTHGDLAVWADTQDETLQPGPRKAGHGAARLPIPAPPQGRLCLRHTQPLASSPHQAGTRRAGQPPHLSRGLRSSDALPRSPRGLAERWGGWGDGSRLWGARDAAGD